MSALKSDLTKIITKIPDITEYWFVRTDDGRYFDKFIESSFIAIGWNEVSLNELRSKNLEEIVRKKLIVSEKLDPDDRKTKGKITGIINKLKIFDSLKAGDIIVVPSKNSARLAFGTIKTGITLVSETSDSCAYRKRKEVEWKEIKSINELDNIFYKIKSNRHSISNINGFGQYIDKVTNTLFEKDNNVHYVIDLKTQKDINVISLLNLIDGIQDLINLINIEFGLNEKVDENAIKLNLQSPGQIEFKIPSGQALILLAMILSSSCSNTPVNTSLNQNIRPVPTNVSDFVVKHKSLMDTVGQSMNDLDADRKKINSY